LFPSETLVDAVCGEAAILSSKVHIPGTCGGGIKVMIATSMRLIFAHRDDERRYDIKGFYWRSIFAIDVSEDLMIVNSGDPDWPILVRFFGKGAVMRRFAHKAQGLLSR
jgi:hypothetical protein